MHAVFWLFLTPTPSSPGCVRTKLMTPQDQKETKAFLVTFLAREMKRKREGEQIYYMEGHEDGINCLAVSADDSFLVSGRSGNKYSEVVTGLCRNNAIMIFGVCFRLRG